MYEYLVEKYSYVAPFFKKKINTEIAIVNPECSFSVSNYLFFFKMDKSDFNVGNEMNTEIAFIHLGTSIMYLL